MNAVPAELELTIWRANSHPITIEYCPAVLDEIRLHAVDGFNRVPHGGVEIGGILFGSRDGDTVRILAHRPLACDYASGPSFTLSPADEHALERSLATMDDELAGLQPVGWYHSHTRSAIFLSARDLEIFDRYFPEPWQIALVVRPANLEPTRAGFFFREPDGSVRNASSYGEFVLQPVAKPAQPARPSIAESVRSVKMKFVAQMPAELTSMEQMQVAQPAAVLPANRALRPSHWKAAAVFVLLACVLLLFQAYARRAPSSDLSLRALDLGDQLRIDWNRRADPILRARSASLEILDGGARRQDELDPLQLRSGTLTYGRRSGDVLVRLTVRLPDERSIVEVTRFLGPAHGREAERRTGEADRVAPQQPVTQPAPAPRSGKIFWTGKLAKRGTIEIRGNKASRGKLTGALPGIPVRVSVLPEPKGKGSKRATQTSAMKIVEPPGARNGWERLVLRAEKGNYSAFVLQWKAIESSPAHGN